MIVARHHLAPAVWDAYVAQHPQGWAFHLSDWLDYLKAAGREDASVARLDAAGTVIGLCPALLPVPLDDPLPAPLGADWVTDWPTRGQPQPEGRAPGFATRVIDLSLPEADLWRGIRRSYHALIHRAEETFTVRTAHNLDGIYTLYKLNPTLPQITNDQWHHLGKLFRAHRLLVYEATDAMGELVGAIGLYQWKGWSYYGHGRSLVPNVNHLLHWHAIRALPILGVRHYEIGWEAREGDDEKARNIAHHKVGFGGERWWVPVW